MLSIWQRARIETQRLRSRESFERVAGGERRYAAYCGRRRRRRRRFVGRFLLLDATAACKAAPRALNQIVQHCKTTRNARTRAFVRMKPPTACVWWRGAWRRANKLFFCRFSVLLKPTSVLLARGAEQRFSITLVHSKQQPKFAHSRAAAAAAAADNDDDDER